MIEEKTEVISMAKDDILVVQMPETWTNGQIQTMAEHIRKSFEDTKIIILPSGVKVLCVVKKEK